MRPESLKYFFDRMGLQLRADELRYHHVRARVRAHRYTDATLAVFHGPGKLATYDTTGQLVSTRREVLKAAAWRQRMTARACCEAASDFALRNLAARAKLIHEKADVSIYCRHATSASLRTDCGAWPTAA